MVRTGDVLPTDLLRKEGMEKWVPAGSIPKLFKRIGSGQRAGPSLLLLFLVGLLLVTAMVASPLGELTSELTGLAYLGCVALSGACFAGSVVLLIVAVIGKEKEPMVVPTEGRLVRNEGAEGESVTDDAKTQQQGSNASGCGTTVAESRAEPKRAKSVVWQACLATLGSWLSNIVVPSGQSKMPSTQGVLAMSVIVVVGLAVTQWLPREPRQHLVAGEVTFQGKPVPVGVIRLTPNSQGQSARPIISGEIRDGRYTLRSGHGSDGGTYAVHVSGFTGIPKQIGAVTDPLGDELFPRITRTVELPCSDHSLNVKCDSD